MHFDVLWYSFYLSVFIYVSELFVVMNSFRLNLFISTADLWYSCGAWCVFVSVS